MFALHSHFDELTLRLSKLYRCKFAQQTKQIFSLQINHHIRSRLIIKQINAKAIKC